MGEEGWRNMSNVFNHKNKPHMQKHVSIEAYEQQQLTEAHSYLLYLGGAQKHILRTILCCEGTVLFLGVFSNTPNSSTTSLLDCVQQYGVLELAADNIADGDLHHCWLHWPDCWFLFSLFSEDPNLHWDIRLMSAIPALRKLRQAFHHEYGISLGCTVSSNKFEQ